MTNTEAPVMSRKILVALEIPAHYTSAQFHEGLCKVLCEQMPTFDFEATEMNLEAYDIAIKEWGELQPSSDESTLADEA